MPGRSCIPTPKSEPRVAVAGSAPSDRPTTLVEETDRGGLYQGMIQKWLVDMEDWLWSRLKWETRNSKGKGDTRVEWEPSRLFMEATVLHANGSERLCQLSSLPRCARVVRASLAQLDKLATNQKYQNSHPRRLRRLPCQPIVWHRHTKSRYIRSPRKVSLPNKRQRAF